jgi:hypothetical protein
MALVLADRVRETTTTTSTGAVTLGGAYTGFQTFSAAIGNANNTYYTIANIATGEWEVGIGTYTLSTNTLSRDTVLSSSNAGSLVVFTAGTKDVFVTQPAERAVYVNAANTQVSVPELAATSITNSGNTTLGDASTDTVTVNGYVGQGVSPSDEYGYRMVYTGSTATAQYGFFIDAFGSSAATGSVSGLRVRARSSAAAYTMGSARGLFVDNAGLGAGSTITNAVGLYIQDQTVGTNNYGIQSAVSSGTNKFNIYASGTAANYFAGTVQFAAGTAALPALTRFGDTNTGIFFPAADTIAFSEGGAEAMRIDSSGNVGIGTSSPASLLTVEGSLDNSAITGSNTPFGIVVDNASTVANSYSQINLLNGGLPTSQNDGWAIRSLYQANNDCDLSFNFLSNSGGTPIGSEKMRIDSSGNVGIGTSSPATKLHVANTGSSAVQSIRLENSEGYAQISTDSNLATYDAQLHLFNNRARSTEYMRIDSSGNVGIGTSSPSDKLTVISAGTQVGSTNFRNIARIGLATNDASVLLGYDVSAGSAILASTNNYPIAFWTSIAGTYAEKMRINSSGNVGIGTSSPTSLLHVSSTTANPQIKIADLSVAGGRGGSIQGSYGGNGLYLDSLAASGWVYIGLSTGGGQATNIRFDTSNTERMRINSSGNVGIGTTSPASVTGYKLIEVQGSTGGIFQASASGNSVKARFYSTNLQGYTGTTSNHPFAFLTNDIERVTIDSSGNVGIGTASPSAPMDVVSNSSAIGTRIRGRSADSYGVLEFTNNSASAETARIAADTSGNIIFSNTGSVTERMRIDSSGNLLVGTTSALGSGKVGFLQSASGQVLVLRSSVAAVPYGLAVNYTNSTPNNTGSQFIYCDDTVGLKMEVRSNGGIANYSANDVNLSDRREKTNFAPATSYLDKICSIPVQTFNYIDQNMEDDGGLTLGVVAQDVQAVAPELVMESNWASKDEEPKMRLSIYQTDLQYALMKCIQEQQALITALTARITALESN